MFISSSAAPALIGTSMVAGVAGSSVTAAASGTAGIAAAAAGTGGALATGAGVGTAILAGAASVGAIALTGGLILGVGWLAVGAAGEEVLNGASYLNLDSSMMSHETLGLDFSTSDFSTAIDFIS